MVHSIGETAIPRHRSIIFYHLVSCRHPLAEFHILLQVTQPLSEEARGPGTNRWGICSHDSSIIQQTEHNGNNGSRTVQVQLDHRTRGCSS